MKRSISCLIGLASVGFLSVVACNEESVNGTPDTNVDGGGVNLPDAKTPEPVCPKSLGPTTHDSTPIKESTTWKAENSPHILTYDTVISAGATLTIEPCVEVQIAKGYHLMVGKGTDDKATLIAEGTATRPIKFTAKDAEPWASLYVSPKGTARLAYATLENGGDGDFEDNATIDVVGNGEMPADDMLFVDHVTIKKSKGTGVWMQRGANFITGSKDLVVAESGSDEFPYPVEIEEHSLDRLPSGTYTGNKKDEIQIGFYGSGTAGAGLAVDSTLHNYGVPYHMGRSKLDYFTIGDPESDKTTTLTIEAGNILKFEDNTVFRVQSVDKDAPARGALRALGTAEKPIVFTSASATPKPGSWRGLWFGGLADANNKLDHVRIEYAGYDCSCILTSCSAITSSNGAVIFTSQIPSAFITNTTFKDIAGHGITQGYTGTFVDFRPTNTFQGLTGCKQTLPQFVAPTSCASPKPSCMND